MKITNKPPKILLTINEQSFYSDILLHKDDPNNPTTNPPICP